MRDNIIFVIIFLVCLVFVATTGPYFADTELVAQPIQPSGTAPMQKLTVISQDATAGHYDIADLSNNGDTDVRMVLKARNDSTDKRFYIEWHDNAGNQEWLLGRNADNQFILHEKDTESHRFNFDDGGHTYLESTLTGAVRINGVNEPNSGSGGFEIYSGGSDPNLELNFDDGRLDIYQQADGTSLGLWGHDDEDANYMTIGVGNAGQTALTASDHLYIATGGSTFYTLGNNDGTSYFRLRNSSAAQKFQINDNGAVTYTPSTAQVIDAATDTIADNATIIVLNPDANYTMTSTPTISNGLTGQLLYITVAQGEPNTVEIQDQDTLASSGVELGDTSRTIGDHDVLCLIYDGTDWLEVSYADN